MWLTFMALTFAQFLQINGQSFKIKVPKVRAFPDTVTPCTIFYDIRGSYFYIGGYSNGPLDNQPYVIYGDALLTKHFLNGTRVWSCLVGGAWHDSFQSIVQHPSTFELFLVGFSQSPPMQQIDKSRGLSDGMLSKISPNGTMLYTRLIGTPNADQFYDAFLDVQTQQISMFGHCSKQICVTMSDMNNGTMLNRFVFFLVGGLAYGITPDSSVNDYYVTGATYQSFEEQEFFGGASDVFLTKMNTMNFTRYWVRIWGSSAADEAYAVQYDSNSQLVFIAGSANSFLNDQKALGIGDALIICASSNGTHVWTRLFGSADPDAAASLLLHRPTGTLFVVGFSFESALVATFAQNGTKVQMVIQGKNSQFEDICIDPTWTKAYVAEFWSSFATLEISGNYSSYSESSSVSVLGTPIPSSTFVSALATSLPSVVESAAIPSGPSITTVTSSQDSSVVDGSSSDVSSISSPDTSQDTFATNLVGGVSTAMSFIIAVAVMLVLVIFLLLFCILRHKRSYGKGGVTTTVQKSDTIMGSAVSSEGTAMNATHGQTALNTLLRSNFELSLPGYLRFQNGIAFRILVQIARGGGGSVWMGEAFDYQLKRFGPKMIVKIVGQGTGSLLSNLTVRQTESFNQEVSIVHFFREEKHIAKLLGWSDAPACLLMKFYPLGSLDKWVCGSSHVPMTKAIAVNFTRDISRGVMAMHNAGFVHCDLKPQNVLVDTDEKNRYYCVLTDFGITQVVNDSSLLVRDFATVNVNGLSVEYAAPELFQRFRTRVTGNVPGELIMKGDLYSLAVIMLELFQRGPPW